MGTLASAMELVSVLSSAVAVDSGSRTLLWGSRIGRSAKGRKNRHCDSASGGLCLSFPRHALFRDDVSELTEDLIDRRAAIQAPMSMLKE